MKTKKSKTAPMVILASIAVALLLFLLLGIDSQFAGGNSGAWIGYYGNIFSGSLRSFFYDMVLFICLLLMSLVIWSFGKSFLTKSKDPLRVFINTARRSREILLIIPAILFVTIVALAMGEANAFARGRLVDGMVIGWEHALFGNFVFAALGNIYYPHWLITFIIFSFENLALILIGGGMIIAYLSPWRFRELLVAFCVGILLMVPVWLTIPVLSPQDRYINNVYNLPDPPPLALAVSNYHPQPEIANFLTATRQEKADLPALPTSTIPSAHVFWAVLAGYYLFRAKKWLGWVALPFLAASTFGTVLLAQHYFTDIPAGIAIAAIAIWLAHDMEKELELAPVFAESSKNQNGE